MRKNKIKTHQTNIVILTAIIFLFIAGKYFFMPTLLPVSFFMFELVSVMTLLLFLYYTDKTIKESNEKRDELISKNQSLNNTIEYLKEELQKRNNTSDKKKSTENTVENIDKIFKNISSTKNSDELYNNILTALSDNYEIVIALFFIYNEQSQKFSVKGNYGIQKDEPITPFVIGEGLHGEALKYKKVIMLNDLPDEYFMGYSGLGESKPKHLYIMPITNEDIPLGIIELASFKPLNIEEVWSEINKKLITLVTVR